MHIHLKKQDQVAIGLRALLDQDVLVSTIPAEHMSNVLRIMAKALGIRYRMMLVAYRKYSKLVDRPWHFE